MRGGSARWGGGIVVVNGARLNLDRCIVSDNSADRLGGGIQLERGEVLASRCIFARNSAEAGAAPQQVQVRDPGTQVEAAGAERQASRLNYLYKIMVCI